MTKIPGRNARRTQSRPGDFRTPYLIRLQKAGDR